MKLYVCYGTWKPAPYRKGGMHPCGAAYHALRESGHRPEVVRTYGLALLGDLFNATPGRREVKRLTGNYWVPMLITDDGDVIQGSQKIVDWARANPASSTGTGTATGTGTGTGAAGTTGSGPATRAGASGAPGADPGSATDPTVTGTSESAG